MGCSRTGSFLDLPLILGCGDQICLSFWEKVSLRTKSYSHQNIFFVVVSVLFLCRGQKFARSSFSSFFGTFSGDSVFFIRSSSLTSFQYARDITTAFLVAFLVFPESLHSIKVCISYSENLEKRFLLTPSGFHYRSSLVETET